MWPGIPVVYFKFISFFSLNFIWVLTFYFNLYLYTHNPLVAIISIFVPCFVKAFTSSLSIVRYLKMIFSCASMLCSPLAMVPVIMGTQWNLGAGPSFGNGPDEGQVGSRRFFRDLKYKTCCEKSWKFHLM